MIRAPLQLRLARAHRLLRRNCVQGNGGPGQFDVWSQRDADRRYHVTILADEIDHQGYVLGTRCVVAQSIDPAEVGARCPDWETMYWALEENPLSPGISHVHYSPACKHVLAALAQMDLLPQTGAQGA